MRPSVKSPPPTAYTPALANRLVLAAWRVGARVLLPLYVVAYHLHARVRPETREQRLARLGDLLGKNSTLYKKQDKTREKTKAPETITLWVHAVSAGELTAGIRLIAELVQLAEENSQATRPWRVLVTGTTLSSARTAERFLPAGADHRFLPLDAPKPVARFLDREQVRLGVLIESEVWPTLAHACLTKKIPLVVASARLSPRSFARAKRHPFLARSLYSLPSLFLARHEEEVEALQNLGGRQVKVGGELKDSALPPAVNQDEVARFKTQLGDAPCWVAVSAHRDEIESLIATHKGLVESGLTNVITLLCPRRPLDKTLERILSLLEASGVAFARRSLGAELPKGGGIYLCDSFGEVGLWCSLASAAFVGGSLIDHGGHNPREPAWFSCALFMGPFFYNQKRAVSALQEAGGLVVVKNTEALVQGLGAVLGEGTENQAGKKAQALVARQGDTALQQTLLGLRPFLESLKETSQNTYSQNIYSQNP